MDENNPPAPKLPEANAIPPENNPPAPAPAAPPAAKLVTQGVKSEREIELEGLLAAKDETLTAAERRALEAERKAAELERDNQVLREVPIPKPVKVKRERCTADIILGNDADEE